MNFEKPSFETNFEKSPAEQLGQKPESVVESEKGYDAAESLRRDFSDEWIYYENGEPLIDDADLNQIMSFYRKEVKEGSLLDLGGGPNHFHYVSAIEDRLSHITTLDLSKRNIALLKEFVDNFDKMDNPRQGALKEEDFEILKCCVEANEIKNAKLRKEKPRPSSEIFQSLKEKSSVEGKPDLILGDMYDEKAFEGRKFDNVMLGFSIFANNEDDVFHLMQKVRMHLNPGGKVLISDFQGFDGEDLEGQFAEDEAVLKKFPNIIDLSPELISSALEKAGFSKNNIKVDIKDPLFEDENGDGEKEKGFKYLFISAKLE